MKIKSFIIFPLLLLLLGITDASILYNVQSLFLMQIFTFTSLIILPGLFINLILKLKNINKLEYLLYAVGGSLTFIMLNGLFINWFLPLKHISNPLTFNYIFIDFNIATFVLWLVAFLRNLHCTLILKKPNITKTDLLLIITPIMFPLMGIIGAIILNNEGSNYMTMAMLGLSAMYLFFTTVIKKNLKESIFPLTLFFVALGVLLMMSLRSWYIAGFDISMEFEVFKITQQKMLWAMANFKNEYNTCLSITILPTYLSALLKVNDVYIYKLFYQIIFAFTPVGIYFLMKKLNTQNILAFLSGLFYVCNPWFIDPMTTLNRQEMAFFFFSIVLLLLFEKRLSLFTKYPLLFILTIGLVISHYSSTYITIILFTLSFFIGTSINVIAFLKSLIFKHVPQYINNAIKLPFLLFLIGITFLWFSVINQSTNNLKDVLTNTYKNLPHILSQSSRTTIIDQVLNLGSQKQPTDIYQWYYNTKTGEYKANKNLFPYDPSKYSGYKPVPKTSASNPIKNKTVYTLVNYFYKFLLVFIEISLFTGTIILFIKKKSIDKNIIIFSIACELLMGLMIALPYISLGYNFDRLYMQMMFILSFVEILGGSTLLLLVTKNKILSEKILSTFFIFVFLFTYGFIWQLTGGKTLMWLNNFGYYYDQSYTSTSDVLAATWMRPILHNPLIESTSSGKNILTAYALKNNIRGDIFPSTIEKQAYVFVTEVNLKEKISSFFYRGNHFEYEYPFEFLNNNKNLIYSNGGAEVYK